MVCYKPAITGLVHKTPFHSCRKTGSPSSTQAGHFDLIENPVHSFIEDLFGLVPVTTALSTFKSVVERKSIQFQFLKLLHKTKC